MRYIYLIFIHLARMAPHASRFLQSAISLNRIYIFFRHYIKIKKSGLRPHTLPKSFSMSQVLTCERMSIDFLYDKTQHHVANVMPGSVFSSIPPPRGNRGYFGA